jgi:lipoprotein-releasing system ATP-binding protein
MTRPGFICVENLHKHYRDGEGRDLHILRGVSLTVERGETVSIMGASGTGKSTLLHLLGALDTPDEGSIQVDGRDIARMDAQQGAAFRNQTIGFVFQFHHLLMDFTALENVMMPMWIRQGRTFPAQAAAMTLLKEVGLEQRAVHRPAQLSGGEQQRLAIARSIANRPKLLLADEPTGNLDEETGNRVSDLLLRLNRDYELTLILVTHNPQFAGRMARRYVLELGHLHPMTAAGGHG